MFISVAPRETAAEKMNKFLDINPMVPRERLFVDDSPTFAAYASAGFKNIGEDQKTSLADATKLTAPSCRREPGGATSRTWRPCRRCPTV